MHIPKWDWSVSFFSELFIRCKKLCRLTKCGTSQKAHPIASENANLFKHVGEPFGWIYWSEQMKSNNSVSGQTPNKMHTYVHQKICSRMLIAPLLVIASNQKLPKSPSTIEWINTFWYSYNGILYSNEDEQCTSTSNIWTNLRNIMLSLKRQL